MITVNGVTLPTPSVYNVGIEDLSKAERNANGDLLIERIATKRKLELSYAYLTNAQVQQVLSAVSPVLFTVTYPDPEIGATNSGTFYSGGRSCGGFRYANGKMVGWRDVKFNLVER